MNNMDNLDTVEQLQEFHWLMDMIQTVDVGIVVVDRQFTIHVWNDFMESHSGLISHDVQGKSIFTVNTDINSGWFTQKTKAVFDLNVRSFMTWEQRAYLFKFPNYRPITGTEPYMYQNVVISPLTSTTGAVEHICIMIYDVTEKALAKKQLETAQVKLDEIEAMYRA